MHGLAVPTASLVLGVISVLVSLIAFCSAMDTSAGLDAVRRSFWEFSSATDRRISQLDYLFESRVIGCIRKNRDDLDAIVRALDPAGTARKTRVDARGRAAAPAPVGELDRETGTLEELIAVGDGESLAPKVGNDR